MVDLGVGAYGKLSAQRMLALCCGGFGQVENLDMVGDAVLLSVYALA